MQPPPFDDDQEKDQLTEETPRPTFDLAAWLADAQRFRAEQRRLYGEGVRFNSQAALDELREEESE
jgi:hypothetical protein